MTTRCAVVGIMILALNVIGCSSGLPKAVKAYATAVDKSAELGELKVAQCKAGNTAACDEAASIMGSIRKASAPIIEHPVGD